MASNITQIATEDPQTIHLEPDAPDLYGMKIIQGKHGAELEVLKPGTYFILFSPQVALLNPGSEGCFDSWLAINGEDVKDSGVRQCFMSMPNSKKEITSVLTGQFTGDFLEGDVISIRFSGKNTRTLYVPPDHKTGRPSIPSVIISAVQL